MLATGVTGICGSGIIEAIAEMFLAGIITADGVVDRASASNLADLLVELNREENVALILITHSPELAERMGCVLELRDGRLVPGSRS